MVVITGSGRSGTSLMAGVLKQLGLYLPQPEKGPDPVNPRGFFESEWVVDLHRSILDPLPVRTGDSRPQAAQLAAEASAAPEITDRLATWLTDQVAVAAGRSLVVKDPRIFWLHDLWRRAARSAGVELQWLSMLRHPTEVARSRDLAFLSGKPAEFRAMRETSNVAGWCNVALASEVATRPETRVFVPYHSVVEDWRAAVGRIAAALALDLGVPDSRPHPVDEFVDPGLVRATVADDELTLPDDLRDIADRVWAAMLRLTDDPQDAHTVAELTALRELYAERHAFAVALAMDEITAREAQVRRVTRRQIRSRRRKAGRRAAARASADKGRRFWSRG